MGKLGPDMFEVGRALTKHLWPICFESGVGHGYASAHDPYPAMNTDKNYTFNCIHGLLEKFQLKENAAKNAWQIAYILYILKQYNLFCHVGVM